MHRRPPLVLIPIVLVLLLAAAWLWGWVGNSLGLASNGSLAGSGVIQVDESIVASEVPGRVLELLVDEGDGVRAGQAVAKLDTTLLSAQVEQADAALAAAEANLAKVQVGARSEEVAQAKAALAQAIARRDGAKTALDDAQALRKTPQDLNMRIDLARATLAAAEHRARAANLLARAATLERDYYQRTLADVENGVTLEIRTPFGVISRTLNVRTEELRTQLALAVAKEWNAWAAQNSAFAQRDGARVDLENLLSIKNDPLALDAQVDAARSQLEAADAAVQAAQARVDALQAGSRAENIAAAQAQVAQATAARDALKAQLNKMTLTAPREGSVAERFLHLGEMAMPGSPVFHIANLDVVTVTIYLPEDQIGRVQAGARADVRVDSFPGRVFAGAVSFVSPQAEFTPKNIATKEQRSTQVFAVQIRLDNPDHVLKPGMPADAVIK